MKKAAILIFILAVSGLSAQVGVGTTTPDASALLDVYSTNSGFLMPRLTTAARLAIALPAAGLQVYDSNLNSIWYFNGTVWVNGGASSTTVSNTILGTSLTTTVNGVTGNAVTLPGATASNGLSIKPITGDVILGGVLTQPTVVSGLTAANTLKFQSTAAADAFITVGTSGNTSGGLYLGNAGHGVIRGFPTLGTDNNIGLYTTAGNLYLSANGAKTEQFELTTAGKATIGVTATPGKLEVIGNSEIGSKSSILSTGTTFAPIGFQAKNGIFDEKVWDMGAYSDGTFKLRVVSDDNSFSRPLMQVKRNGNTSDYVSFPYGDVGIGTLDPHAPLHFGNSLTSNRKIVLYENFNDENQFYGFGINPNILRYQIPSTAAANAHVFYAGNGAAASNELMRITGSGLVGIGTNGTPTANLHVKGSVRFETAGTPAAGRVLTSDATGNATWQPTAGLNTYWSKTGDAATVDGTNFIGTTDNVPFTIRINNTLAGRLENASQNAFYGLQAGVANTTGNLNTAIGGRAMIRTTTGKYNTAIGSESLFWNVSGYGNTALGLQALLYTLGDYNTALGYQAMTNNTNGSYNIAIGAFAGPSLAAFNITKATAIGYNAIVTQSSSMVLGGTGADAVNVGIGVTAPATRLEVVGTIRANPGNTPSFQAYYNTGYSGYLEFWRTGQAARDGYIGYGEGGGGINLSSEISGKALRFTTANGDITLSSGTAFVGIGTTAPTANLDVVGTVRFRTAGTPAAGRVLTATDATGLATWQPGSWWGLSGNLGTTSANFIGTTDNMPFTIKINNIQAGRLETYNAFYGLNAGIANTGANNTGIGLNAMTNNTTGYLNTAVGAWSLTTNTVGFSNTAVGYHALSISTAGNYNAALGFRALELNISGSENTAVGTYAGPNSGNLSNTTAIGYNAKVDTSNSLALGGTGAYAVKVGIGTSAPTSKLHVVGLPVYTSDTSAGVGGLTAGAFYQDASGFVKVKQ